jgi:hypothetical protein
LEPAVEMEINMSCSIAVNEKTVNQTDNASKKFTVENKEDRGLRKLTKGQQITGKVVAVEDKVTLDFDGQTVDVNRSLFGNVAVGDIKSFEVLKASNNEIELKLTDSSAPLNNKTMKVSLPNEADWDLLRAKQEKDAKRAEQDAQYKNIKDKLEEISAKLTEQDCKSLEKEEIILENYTIAGLYQALSRIKEDMPGTDQSYFEKMTSYDNKAISDRLKVANLPATEENLSKLTKALELCTSVENMDDRAMKYLISTGSKPTAENIYKACYSTSIQNQSGKLSDKVWNELENQIKNVIHSAGYEADEKNLQDAKWLIENQLPLTAESFTYKKNLEEMKSGTDKNDVFNKMVEGMKRGVNPKDVSLEPEKLSTGEELLKKIASISDEAVTEAVKSGEELTVRRLATIQEGLDAGQKTRTTDVGSVSEAGTEGNHKAAEAGNYEAEDTELTVTKDYSYDELRAKRQLEEIRLKMTLEAANRLEKKGFPIETEELEKVVTELRRLEDNYYKNRLKEAEADTSDVAVQRLKDTTQGIEALRNMPCAILGSTLPLQSTQTINGLISEGNRLQAEYAKAGEAYETLSTVPNAEYGDSLKKAFANAGTLLTQLHLEDTQANQRAVRILGYNQMEISKESINSVKAYDHQVTSLINNLHPAVTVRLIKEGINPLNIPIDELNSRIDQLKEEQGITSEDKYSNFLRNLEKQNGINEDERKAYIGIYRLLYNINKSDGAALGAVLKADQEVTLGNLLTAVSTDKKGGINAAVKDDFGTLQSLSRNRDTIGEQLSMLTGESPQSDTGQFSEHEGHSDGSSEKKQMEYISSVLKQISDQATPQKLKEAERSFSRSAGSQQTMSMLFSSEHDVLDNLKNVPVEKLLEQLQKTQDSQKAEDHYSMQVQAVRELCKTSEQSIRFLNDYHVPSTPLNITMANNLLSNGESTIKKVLKLKDENSVENLENSVKEINDLTDKLNDKQSMKEAYEQLATDAKAALVKACSSENNGIIDSRRLAELKSMSQQMTFLSGLADREFYRVPIETDGGITEMNLTIIRGTQSSGKVSVSIASKQLGNIKAEFSLKYQELKGFFSSDNRDGLKLLQGNIKTIEKVAQDNDLAIKQIDFGFQVRENDTYSYQNYDSENQASAAADDTERNLYRIAKAVVLTVRNAENYEKVLYKAV